MGHMLLTLVRWETHTKFKHVTRNMGMCGRLRRMRAVQKDTELFNFLLYLQLNQTCLLQSTPLYCWYTAPSDFFQFWNASWNVFCGMARRSLANFLLSPLSPLPSEIGDLLGWTSTLGTGKSPQGPNLEIRGAGARQSSLASPKIHG